jgi:hypothetical protein
VDGQRLHRGRREAGHPARGLAPQPDQEVLGQDRDVARARAQGRHHDVDHRQSIVEVLTELTEPDHLAEIAVGGRHDAHVDLERPRAADPLEALLLEHAQELGLARQRHLADLVEEERALVGRLEAAHLSLGRAGERALLVAEQLRLDERLGQRGAVDRDECLPPPATGAVHRARHHLLAAARLAGEQHRGVGRADLGDERQHRARLRRRADELAAARLLLERLVLALQHLARRQPGHDRRDQVRQAAEPEQIDLVPRRTDGRRDSIGVQHPGRRAAGAEERRQHTDATAGHAVDRDRLALGQHLVHRVARKRELRVGVRARQRAGAGDQPAARVAQEQEGAIGGQRLARRVARRGPELAAAVDLAQPLAETGQ